MSCTHLFCDCYLRGIRDGFRRGYKRGYIDGYVDSSPNIPAPVPFQDGIRARRAVRSIDHDTFDGISFWPQCRRPYCRAIGHCVCL